MPTPYGLLFPKTQPPPKTSIAVISGMGEATDFKFVLYIHPNKSPLKILEKRQRGRIQGLPTYLWISPIISGNMNSKFCSHIHRIDNRLEQKPVKNFGKSSRGRTQGLSKIFTAPVPYIQSGPKKAVPQF